LEATDRIQFGKAASYVLTLRGPLASDVEETLSELGVKVIEASRGTERTRLVVRVRDQGQLSGILNAVRELGVTLLSLSADEPPD